MARAFVRLSRKSGAATVAHAGDNLAVQFGSRRGVDSLVDGLTKDSALAFVVKHAVVRSHDLLERPLALQAS